MSAGVGPIDPVARILVVCTGNVCRSPLVERLLQGAVDRAYGPGTVQVTSAGTGALAGRPMDERSARVLTDLGGRGDGFVARQLQEPNLRAADLVLTATRAHRAAAVREHPRALLRAFTIRELALLLVGVDLNDLPTAPAQRVQAVAAVARSRKRLLVGLDPSLLDVVDPFRQPEEVYAQMQAEVAPAVRVIAAALAGRS